MTELRPDLADALRHVDTEWTDERSMRSLRGMKKKRRRRRAVRAGASVAVMMLVAVGAYRWIGGEAPALAEHEPATEQLAPSPGPVAEPMSGPESKPEELATALPGGGEVVGESDDAVVEIEEAADARPTRVRVVSGKNRVKAEADTPVEVRAGNLVIVAQSVEFSVARYRNTVQVEVHRGKLLVRSHSGQRELAAGQQLEVNDDEAPVSKPRAPDWRSLADGGELQAAYAALERSSTPSRPADLMTAADLARATGHHREAVGYLQLLLKRHRRDSRGPLAAFTVGRIEIEKLRRPADAARAFALARQLAPSGPLAEDALAREATAWAKAGNPDRARERARVYLQRHPDGHRARAMRDFAGSR